MIYPVLNESRALIDLSGIWDFKLDNGDGFEYKWYEKKLEDSISIAVPASYNDQVEETPNMFTEEYQVEFLKANHEIFDNNDFFVGEQVWNFADFATIQGINRVDGNKKGIFTRDRRPKLAAHYLKDRWSKIPDFNYKC